MEQPHRIWFICVTVICLLFLPLAAYEPPETKYRGPICLGGFCFDNDSLEEKALIQQYGTGYAIPGVATVHCYAVTQQHFFVHLMVHHDEVVDIFVSDQPNCPKSKPAKKPFPRLSTSEGIVIGDSCEKAVATYGKPSRTDNGDGFDMIGLDQQTASKVNPFGDTVLYYEAPADELLEARIFCRKGKVSAIAISNSE